MDKIIFFSLIAIAVFICGVQMRLEWSRRKARRAEQLASIPRYIGSREWDEDTSHGNRKRKSHTSKRSGTSRRRSERANSADRKADVSTTEEDGFMTSAIAGALTNSTLAGALFGGSIVGAAIGDAIVPDQQDDDNDRHRSTTSDDSSSHSDHSDSGSYDSGSSDSGGGDSGGGGSSD